MPPQSAVLSELRALSQTLSSGIPLRGQGKLQAASLLNTQAKDRYAMERQTGLDDLVRPSLELQRDKAQRKIDWLNSDFTLASSTNGNLWQMGHQISKPKKDEFDSEEPVTMHEEIAKAYGASFDKNKDSPTYGKSVFPDGSTMKNAVIDNDPGPYSIVVMGRLSGKRSARDIIEQIDTHKAAIKKAGKTDPNAAKLDTARVKAERFLTSEKLQIEAIDNQINHLLKFEGTEKYVARLEKKSERLHKEYLTKIVAKAKAVTAVKDSRSKMEKEVDLLAEAYSLSKKDATSLWRSDDKLKEKLRLAAELIEGAGLDVQMDDKAMSEHIENVLKITGLDKPIKPDAPTEGLVEQDPNNPLRLIKPTAEDYSTMSGGGP